MERKEYIISSALTSLEEAEGAEEVVVETTAITITKKKKTTGAGAAIIGGLTGTMMMNGTQKMKTNISFGSVAR